MMSNLVLVASTVHSELTSIGRGPSLNNNGLIAFTGTNSGGEGIYVGNSDKSDMIRVPRNINPRCSGGTEHTFGEYVQINDFGNVVACQREYGNSKLTFVRVWDSQAEDSYTTIGMGGESCVDFTEIMSYPSINNSGSSAVLGQVVFCAARKRSPFAPVLVTSAPGASGRAYFHQSMLSGKWFLPRIADNGRIVISARDETDAFIWVYSHDLSGDPDDPAHMRGPNPSFSEIGGNPGISNDGRIVAFYGVLTSHAAKVWRLSPGPGIFASVLITGLGWTLHRVADIGDGGLRRFVKHGFIGVNSVRMFTYVAEDGAGNQGIYMTRLSFFSAAPPEPEFRAVAEPVLIAAQGKALDLADGSSLGTVQDIDIAHSPNLAGDVVFWVQGSDQSQSVVLMTRCGLSDYQDQLHATYINQHAAGNSSPKFPVGLPRNSHLRRGGNACGASALTMLLNSISFVSGERPANRYDLTRIYRAVVKNHPVVDGAVNWYDLERAIALSKSLGFTDVKYVEGKAAIDAQLDSYTAVVASTRFGGPNSQGEAKWGRGHIILLLARTSADSAAACEGFYVVDDPGGYVTQTSTVPLGHRGARFCGEHVIYPESMVADALWRQNNKLGLIPRGGVAIGAARGVNRNVLLISGMFIYPDSRPFQLWLEDAAGRRTGWLPDGRVVDEIPHSTAVFSAIIMSDPMSLPWASPDGVTWPYAMPITDSGPDTAIFVYGNVHGDYALETLLFTPNGVIRSVTTGTVAQGETRQVAIAAPVLYNLKLGASAGGRVNVSPSPGPYPDGAEVVVEVVPDEEYVFVGYTIDGISGYLEPSLRLHMDTDHTVTAEFTTPVRRVLRNLTFITSPRVPVGTHSD
jgi:Divergent InlB B-repeat domain